QALAPGGRGHPLREHGVGGPAEGRQLEGGVRAPLRGRRERAQGGVRAGGLRPRAGRGGDPRERASGRFCLLPSDRWQAAAGGERRRMNRGCAGGIATTPAPSTEEE